MSNVNSPIFLIHRYTQIVQLDYRGDRSIEANLKKAKTPHPKKNPYMDSKLTVRLSSNTSIHFNSIGFLYPCNLILFAPIAIPRSHDHLHAAKDYSSERSGGNGGPPLRPEDPAA